MVDTFKQDRKFALKIDKTVEVKTVKQEQKVLKRLQSCPCVVRLVEQGSHGERSFIVMEVTAACRPCLCGRCHASLMGRTAVTPDQRIQVCGRHPPSSNGCMINHDHCWLCESPNANV